MFKNKNNFDFRLLYAGSLLLFLLLFKYETHWSFFQNFLKFESWSLYGDLRLLLKGVDLYSIGKDPFLENYEPPYNYPSTWRFFSYVPGFNSKNYLFIGFLLVFIAQLLFISTTGIWSNFKKAGFYILILLSPVSLLLFERGNNDIFIYIFVIIPILIKQNKYLFLLFFLVSVALKIYPLGLFIVLFYLFNLKDRKEVYLLLSVFIFLMVCLFLNRTELIHINKNTPISYRELSYGITLILDNIIMRNPKMEHFSIAYYIGYFLVIFIFLIIFLKRNLRKVNALQIENLKSETLLFLSGAGIFLFSYLFTISWEYRLFFLTLCLPAIISWKNSKVFGAKFFLICVLLIFWNQAISVFYEKFIDSNANNIFLFNQILLLVVFGFIVLYSLKIFNNKSVLPKFLNQFFK